MPFTGLVAPVAHHCHYLTRVSVIYLSLSSMQVLGVLPQSSGVSRVFWSLGPLSSIFVVRASSVSEQAERDTRRSKGW